MPELSDTAVAELRAALPSFGTPHNPLDITGGAVLQPDLFEQGLRILGQQPEFSALACLFDVPVAEEHATEFVLAALRHIAAGLHAADAAGTDDQPHGETGDARSPRASSRRSACPMSAPACITE